MRVLSVRLAVLLVAAAAVVSAAQQPAFRAATDLVPLSVTVTNAEHQYVTDLTKDDFVVLEDGKQQALSYFGRSNVPLAVALLIDSSASMLTTLPTAQEAAVGFVRELTERDLAMIVDFDTKVQIRQPFTGDHALLEEAILRTTAGGSTMLNTAVYVALRELARLNVDEGVTARRRAIVLLSDGEDTNSLVSFDDVLDLAGRSNIVIYAIGLRGDERFRPRRTVQGDFVLRRFATQTGGRALFPSTMKDIVDSYSDIRRELANQYVLAYESPPGPARRWRNVAVRVNRTGAVARTRPGYFGR